MQCLNCTLLMMKLLLGPSVTAVDAVSELHSADDEAVAWPISYGC